MFTITKPGGSFIYFTGNLALHSDWRSGSPLIRGLRDKAWKFAAGDSPKGFLTQRKLVKGCDYIFTRAKEEEK